MSLTNRKFFEGLQKHGLLFILSGYFVAGKLSKAFPFFLAIKVQDILIPERMKHFAFF